MVDDIWEQFLDIIRKEAGSRIVETWFRVVALQRWDATAKEVHLKAPNTFVKNWVCNNYLPLFQLHLGRLLNIQNIKVIFSDASKGDNNVDNRKNEKVIVGASLLPKEQSKNDSRYKLAVAKKNKNFKNISINEQYRFDNFVVGPNNSLAHAAAEAITTKPGTLYNPLFIYGGAGLGKTHLLHAISNGLREYNSNFCILYQTADRFVNEFIYAIRFDKMHLFQQKYQRADVLLIDDIQFISKKEQTQEVFFYIFNTLYDARKQLVFSSDTFPQDIKGVADRLRSRLGWGLVTDIHVPDVETKIAILKKKSGQKGVVLSDDVAHFIASRSFSNVRELEGALVRVIAFAQLAQQEITVDAIQHIFTYVHSSPEKEESISFDRIIKGINTSYVCNMDQLRSKDRSKNIVLARYIAMLMMKKLMKKSLRDIGQILGKRSHATVVHGLEKIEKKIHESSQFKEKVSLIERTILQR